MTDKKKLLCGLVSVLFILCLAMPVFSTVVGADPATQIWDWHDLHDIRNNLGASYVLMTHLHSGTAGYAERAGPAANAGNGWQPIGTSANRFSGTFDGQGHEIRDLVVARSGENYAGLFGAVAAGAIVQNTGVMNAAVTGSWYVGGVAGANWGTVSTSYSTGSVTGSYRVGGLAGFNFGTVSNSYSTATASGVGHVGGLVAENFGGISNCYSTGSVSGSFSVGGLVGSNAGTVSNCFWNRDSSGMMTSAGGTGQTTSEMQDIATFSGAGWDIGTTSVADPTGGYPFLSWQIGNSPIWLIYQEAVVHCVSTSTGTGQACFTTSHGNIVNLTAESVPAGAPAGFTLPHGLFSFQVVGLANGQQVTITVELPTAVPAGTRWWKYHSGQWHDYNVPITVAGNTITITLTDGGPGDADLSEDGIITDPGGPGYPLAVGWETYPVNKAAVMAPWLALFGAIIAGAGLMVQRRRRA